MEINRIKQTGPNWTQSFCTLKEMLLSISSEGGEITDKRINSVVSSHYYQKICKAKESPDISPKSWQQMVNKQLLIIREMQI